MFCKSCGKELADHAKFCGGCGQTVSGYPVSKELSATPSPKKSGNKAKGIIILLIVLLVLLVLTLTALLMYKKGVFDNLFSSEESDMEEEDEDWKDDRDDDGKNRGNKDRDDEGDDEGVGMEDEGEREPEVTTAPIPESTPVPTPTPTPTPVTSSEIHSYQFVIADVTWQEAAQRCRDNGGYLVNINSQEEYDYILSLISAYDMGEVIWWLGGCRQDNSYDYTWILENGYLSGEILNGDAKYQNYWLSGEPSFGNEQVKEQYLTMFYHTPSNGYVWNDVPNDVVATASFYTGKLGYICEYNDNMNRETVGYVLPASSFRYLEESELSGLSAEECRIARNEIFARHGRKFSDAELQAYFNTCYWYKGTVESNDFDASVLNAFEVYNRDLIVEYEYKMGYR